MIRPPPGYIDMPTAINAIVKARFGREAALETQVDDKGRTLRRWISLNTTNDPAVKEAVDWLTDALRFEEIEAFTYDQEAVTRVNSGYWIPRGNDTFSTGDIAIPRGTFVSNPEYPNNDGAGLCFQELAFMKALSIGQDTKLKAIDSPKERLDWSYLDVLAWIYTRDFLWVERLTEGYDQDHEKSMFAERLLIESHCNKACDPPFPPMVLDESYAHDFDRYGVTANDVDRVIFKAARSGEITIEGAATQFGELEQIPPKTFRDDRKHGPVIVLIEEDGDAVLSPKEFHTPLWRHLTFNRDEILAHWQSTKDQKTEPAADTNKTSNAGRSPIKREAAKEGLCRLYPGNNGILPNGVTNKIAAKCLLDAGYGEISVDTIRRALEELNPNTLK
jgi:hypothetical protein